MSEIKKIKEEYLLELDEDLDQNKLNEIKTELFGKNGVIATKFKQLGSIPENKRKKFASELNYLKNELEELISKKNENIILGGDFNIIPAPEDVYNPKSFEDDALYRLEIRKKLREMINLGFHDGFRHINSDKEGYTFWDYMRGAWQKNNGMRIDHFLISNSLLSNVKNVKINKDPRGKEKPSDHTPIEIELA